ncbi:MAG TPA: magnesium chelatase ATPase subunit I [Steroidobacteraceae bacterium]|nr:magnesium chelatase ATPase subunit I [Steroidobacteraceae bacterium]
MAYPFSALVGQEETKQALLVAAIDPGVGGVLLFGDRGTGKSTAVRALAQLLPPMRAVTGCRYACDPGEVAGHCEDCGRRAQRGRLKSSMIPVPVVDLPLGATEDRVLGSIDLERALSRGEKAFEPGLLARANRGFLYVDEVNLLEDHLVDLLLDVAASGHNIVEREGLSIRHPARFVLIGSGNPEEGELRPQLLDRFGLTVEIRTPADLTTRVEVIRRRDEYERSPAAFLEKWSRQDEKIRRRILLARRSLNDTSVPDQTLRAAAELCMRLGTDGLRGELTLIRAARALAAWRGDATVREPHLTEMAAPALRHRLRRDPLEEAGSTIRVERAVKEQFGAAAA